LTDEFNSVKSTTMNSIPDNYSGAIPYLNVTDGPAALDFYERAFGGRVEAHLTRPDGIGGTPIQILVYVEDRRHRRRGARPARRLLRTAASGLERLRSAG
jgi:hypothetical protein